MEIKNVVNEVENEYPKMKQINKKYLENNIPNKWLKIGIFSLGISMVIKNRALAAIVPMDLAGGFYVAQEIPMPVQIFNDACPIIQIVSAVAFIMSGLNILITKKKSKKQNEPRKVGKLVKAIFIISILLFILSFVVKIVLDNMYN